MSSLQKSINSIKDPKWIPFNKYSKVLFDSAHIKLDIEQLSNRIYNDYLNNNCRELIVICVLRGAVFFLTDLLYYFPNNEDINIIIDFIRTSSYGDNTESSGNVKILSDIQEDIEDKDVLIVEDIIDTGNTLFYLKDYLLKKNPKSLKICCMLNKESRRIKNIKADYVLYDIPDVFVYGKGLDPHRHFMDILYK